MNAAIRESLAGLKEICRADIRNDCSHDQIVEVDSSEDSMIFSIADLFMVLLVYLGPVIAFGYLVAPVVAGLMRMPISY
jgi:hypothetical protein